MTGVFIRREEERRGKYHEKVEVDSDTSKSQGTPRMASNHQKLEF